jgi:hypothetical protein
MTPEAADTHGPKRRSRWRWLLRFAVLVLLVLAGWWAYDWWTDREEQAVLDEVIAQLDKRDSKWRLEDLVAELPQVPDGENGALRALAAYALRPKDGLSWEFEKTLNDLAPNEQLAPDQVKRLRQYIDSAAPALAEARKMANMPRGRFPIDYSHFNGEGYIWTPNNEARSNANHLMFDLRLHAQDRDLAGALICSRAIWNQCQYLRAEPERILQIAMLAMQNYALGGLERILGQGEIGEPVLLEWQDRLRQESQYPWLKRILRVERACRDRYFAMIDRGEIPHGQLVDEWLGLQPRDVFRTGWKPIDGFLEVHDIHERMGSVKLRRAGEIERHTESMATADLPPEERNSDFDDYLARYPVGSIFQLNNYDVRSKTRFRCMVVLLAVERFRLAVGRWPNNSDELTPKFLEAVPVDPYAKAPLRYKRLANGVVVYSVGKNATDDGGDVAALHPDDDGAAKDIGFRLWDPDKRRQPAKAKPAEEKEP